MEVFGPVIKKEGFRDDPVDEGSEDKMAGWPLRAPSR